MLANPRSQKADCAQLAGRPREATFTPAQRQYPELGEIASVPSLAAAPPGCAYPLPAAMWFRLGSSARGVVSLQRCRWIGALTGAQMNDYFVAVDFHPDAGERPMTAGDRALDRKIITGGYKGSRHDGRLFEFLAEERPLKLRFPEAALRH